MNLLKSIFFISIGVACLVNSARLHFMHKKENKNFLDDAPAAPLYFYFLGFGIFFIFIGILKFPDFF
jgi:hypothetical protein